LEGNFRHIFQNGRIHSANGGVLDSCVRRPILYRLRWTLLIMAMVRDRLRRCRGVSVFQIHDTGLFGAAHGIMYSAHLVP
jgi:hypothetical protein